MTGSSYSLHSMFCPVPRACSEISSQTSNFRSILYISYSIRYNKPTIHSFTAMWLRWVWNFRSVPSLPISSHFVESKGQRWRCDGADWLGNKAFWWFSGRGVWRARLHGFLSVTVNVRLSMGKLNRSIDFHSALCGGELSPLGRRGDCQFGAKIYKFLWVSLNEYWPDLVYIFTQADTLKCFYSCVCLIPDGFYLTSGSRRVHSKVHMTL